MASVCRDLRASSILGAPFAAAPVAPSFAFRAGGVETLQNPSLAIKPNRRRRAPVPGAESRGRARGATLAPAQPPLEPFDAPRRTHPRARWRLTIEAPK